MPMHGDIDYFLRRAADEIELARRAKHGAVAEAHYKMAANYLKKVGEPEPANGEAASGPHGAADRPL